MSRRTPTLAHRPVLEPTSPMRFSLIHRVPAALAALGLALTAACNGDSTTGAPAAAPAARAALTLSTDSTTIVPLLGRSTPLAQDVTYTADISGNGGAINIPEAGLKIVIPSGAFPGKKPIRFTVTAVAGNAVAYKFGPHGMKFAKPISAMQDLSVTTYNGTAPLSAGYFATDTDVNTKFNFARISETMPADLRFGGSKVHWDIPHFSGYVIATGRGGGN